MSLTAIEQNLFNTQIALMRRAETVNDIGDFTESFSVIASGIRASVQPANANDIKEYPVDQGAEYLGLYKIYSNVSAYPSGVQPQNHDQIVDLGDNKVYTVKDIQKQKTPFGNHHYKLMTTILQETS